MTRFAFYIFDSLFGEIRIFLRHWYKNGFLRINHAAIAALNSLDKYFAVKVSLKNLFQPLYQDRTVIGYILGFIFRLIRIALGTIIYAVVILVSVFVYLIWAAFPIYAALRAVKYNVIRF